MVPGTGHGLSVAEGTDGADPVGLCQAPDVVDLEAGALEAPLHLPQPVLAVLPFEVELARVAGQRGARRIEGHVVGVRPLVVSGAGFLHLQHRRRVPAHMAESSIAAELVLAALEPKVPVRAAAESVSGEGLPKQILGRRTHIPSHTRQGEPHRGDGGPQLLLETEDPPAGQGLDPKLLGLGCGRVEHRGVLVRRQRPECADREPGVEAPRQLRGPQNRRQVGRIHEVASDQIEQVLPTTGRRTDPPGEVITRSPTPQELVTLDEERPSFREEDFELREVHHGGVGLDLAEVRVHGGIKGEVRPEARLQVQPEAWLELAAILEWVRLLHQLAARERSISGYVWDELHRPAGGDGLDSRQISEPGGPTRLVPGHGDPEDVLVLRRDEAVDVDSPRLFVARLEAELREGDRHLGRPPLLVDVALGLPDRVEGAVARELAVIGMIPIQPHAGCRDREAVGGTPILVAVDRDDEALGVPVVVPPGHDGPDVVRILAVHPSTDVELLAIVGEGHLGALRGRSTLHRLLLDEVGGKSSSLPHLVVQSAIDLDRRFGRNPEGLRRLAHASLALGSPAGTRAGRVASDLLPDRVGACARRHPRNRVRLGGLGVDIGWSREGREERE